MAGSTMAERRHQVGAEELARFECLGRDSHAATAMAAERVAGALGLSSSDHKCLDLAIGYSAPLTAGRIAQLSGLSTGAVTGVVDRLERLGYVRRVRDPRDRRKVLVEVTPSERARITRLTEAVRTALARVLARYSPEQRQLIYGYGRELLAQLREALDEGR